MQHKKTSTSNLSRLDASATNFFTARFSMATNRGRLLFKGGVHFVGKLADTMTAE